MRDNIQPKPDPTVAMPGMGGVETLARLRKPFGLEEIRIAIRRLGI